MSETRVRIIRERSLYLMGFEAIIIAFAAGIAFHDYIFAHTLLSIIVGFASAVFVMMLVNAFMILSLMMIGVWGVGLGYLAYDWTMDWITAIIIGVLAACIRANEIRKMRLNAQEGFYGGQ